MDENAVTYTLYLYRSRVNWVDGSSQTFYLIQFNFVFDNGNGHRVVLHHRFYNIWRVLDDEWVSVSTVVRVIATMSAVSCLTLIVGFLIATIYLIASDFTRHYLDCNVICLFGVVSSIAMFYYLV